MTYGWAFLVVIIVGYVCWLIGFPPSNGEPALGGPGEDQSLEDNIMGYVADGWIDVACPLSVSNTAVLIYEDASIPTRYIHELDCRGMNSIKLEEIMEGLGYVKQCDKWEDNEFNATYLCMSYGDTTTRVTKGRFVDHLFAVVNIRITIGWWQDMTGEWKIIIQPTDERLFDKTCQGNNEELVFNTGNMPCCYEVKEVCTHWYWGKGGAK